MTHESYKAWLDEMPIDDVRRRIERIEHKLSDLHTLERLYDERHGGEAEPNGASMDAPGEGPSVGEADPSAPGGEDHEHGSEHEHS